MSFNNTSHIAAERSVNEMLAARGRYEEEMVRLHQRVEAKEVQMQEQITGAEGREQAAKTRAAQLEARVKELESQTQELKDTVEDVRTDSYRLGAASTRSNAKLQAQVKMYKEKLRVSTELQEMYKDSAQTLQDELARAHTLISDQQEQPCESSTAAAQQSQQHQHQHQAQQPPPHTTSGPWVQIYNQELQKANEENMKLEVKLHHLQTRVQQLQATELVNETLQADKDRLKARLESMDALKDEHINLNAKILNLELEARLWAAFTNTSDYKTPQQLARHVADLESRVESSNNLLDTHKKIIQIQRNAAGRAQVLDARVKMLDSQLSESLQRESKLRIQLAASQTRVEILEGHLAADKNPIDMSCIDALNKRIDAIPIQEASNKRELGLGEDDALDDLATKLMQSERRAEETNQKLSLALKDLDVLESQAKLQQSGPRPPAVVMELKGSPHDERVKSLDDLLQGLERENEALKKQLAGKDIRTVPLESISVLNTRLEKIKRDADTKYQGLDHLLRGFRSKVSDTKSAERIIFGYELELKNNVTCLVRSDHALNGTDTSLEESVNFFEIFYDPVTKKYSDISCNSLLRQYDELYQVWVRQRKYLPGFLASVLLQNYEKYSKIC